MTDSDVLFVLRVDDVRALAPDEFDTLWSFLGTIAMTRAGLARMAASNEPTASLPAEGIVELAVEPPAKASRPARPARPLTSVKVLCEPGCGELIDSAEIGPHRRSCEAVLRFKQERGVRVIPGIDGPAPLPAPAMDREDLERRRIAASAAAVDETWRRTHTKRGEPMPVDQQPGDWLDRGLRLSQQAEPALRSRKSQWTPEARERQSAAMVASHARRRAAKSGEATETPA